MNRLLLALLLLTLSSTSFAQFSYAPVNVPGAVETDARGINNNGEIVGFYKTASCTEVSFAVPNCTVKGFKFVNGAFVKLMVPNSVSTAILGVNDLGDLVGFYKKSDGSEHGFIWFHTNVVKTIDYPHPPSGTNTIPFGINKAGTVVGGLWGNQNAVSAGGWVWVNGTFSNMNPTRPGAVAPSGWSVNGIANSGVISGQLFQDDNFQAWFKQGTDQDFFLDGGTEDFGYGVNSNADLVGFSPQHGGFFAPHIEANEGTSDSTETEPTFKTVAFPNAKTTVPFGVNNLKAVVGTYTDSSGKVHGFMAKANF